MANLTILFKSLYHLFKKNKNVKKTKRNLIIKTTPILKNIEVISPYEYNLNGELTEPFKPLNS